MALGATNITTGAVRNEIGSISNSISVLVGVSGLNKFSFYAPGELSVDANKDIVLTPPITNFKLGDFRLYNHTADPTAPPSGSVLLNWGPTGSTMALALMWYPNTLNIKEIAGYDDYVTMNVYFTDADRTAETNRKHQQVFAITYYGITPLIGHTRQITYQCDPHQICSITGLPILGLTTPNANLYIETFISNLSGDRKVNLGNIRTDGYTNQPVHQLQNPYISGTSNQDIMTLPPTPVPTGYLRAYPRVYSVDTPACSTGSTIQTAGGTFFDTYVHLWGYQSLPNPRVIEVESCDIILTIKNAGTTVHTETVATGVKLLTAGSMYRLYGDLTGYTWTWDDVGSITFNNVVFASTTPTYVAC